MGMITSIRAPLPVAESPNPAPVDGPRPGQTPGTAAGPVAATILDRAVQQAPPRTATEAPHLLDLRQTAETSAAAAAEAARDAYIRASIAAGISPLPLPGR